MPTKTLEVARAAVPAARAPAARLAFMDHLKVLLTIAVVAHHAGQPYGPTGGRWPLDYPAHSALLGPFFHVNASFFMGLFFLMSGFFLPASYDRKGPAHLLKDRFVRFGSMLLLFALVLFPVLGYLVEARGSSFWAYYETEIFVRHRLEFGHLWLIAHLLVYALLYTAWRTWRSASSVRQTPRAFPSHAKIAAYALLLALASGIVRVWYPIDRWVFLGVPAELAHMPQYASLLVLGIVAYRRAWLPQIPPATGRLWLGIGLAAAVFRYAYTIAGWHFLRGRGAIWNLWEAFLCVGLCVGLLHLFRARINRSSAFSDFLSRNAYGVYLVHLPIVVAVQFALARSGYGPLTLTALATVAAVVASYAVIELLRRIPGATRVL